MYVSFSYAQESLPVLQVDTTPVYILMDNPSITTRTINFTNQGKAGLEYAVSIDYVRKSDWNKGKEDDREIISDSIPISRKYQYVDTLLLSASYGRNEAEATTMATRFNGGAAGINISDVGTWFFCENIREGTLTAEIRAGGNSIDESFLISKGTLTYKEETNPINGRLYRIKLDYSASIYPYEDFYVVITYPKGIKRPQGCVVHETVETVNGRFLVNDKGSWRNIQQAEGYTKYGFIMYAAERSAKNSSWMTLITTPNGKLSPGGRASASIRINGNPARLGAQYADVVIRSNDPVKPEARVPVILRRNEAPYFENAPKEVSIVEDSLIVVEMTVVDYEDDKFTIEPVQGCKIASFSIKDSLLTVRIAPKKGDAGDYIMTFKATDEHKLVRELTLKINVSQPPAYYGPRQLVISFREDSVIYDIHDLFRDPDGDKISFTVSGQDEGVITVSQINSSLFAVKPLKVGNGNLLFEVRDERGSKTNTTVEVVVGECTNPEGIVRQKWNSILFVDNSSGNFAADGYLWYKNHEPIEGANKQFYSSENNTNGGELDYAAEYYVRMVTVAGDTVYSCPVYPSKRSLAISAGPNPVSKGGTLQIEADIPGNTNSEGYVQFFNLAGQLERTVKVKGSTYSAQVPNKEGIYLVRVIAGNMTKTFMIKVN